MGTHPIFESDFDCLTEKNESERNFHARHSMGAVDFRDWRDLLVVLRLRGRAVHHDGRGDVGANSLHDPLSPLARHVHLGILANCLYRAGVATIRILSLARRGAQGRECLDRRGAGASLEACGTLYPGAESNVWRLASLLPH